MYKTLLTFILVGWFFAVQHDMTGIPGAKAKIKVGPFTTKAACELAREEVEDLSPFFTGFKLDKCLEETDV